MINSAAMNTGVHASLSDLVSLVCMPRSGIAGSYGSSIGFTLVASMLAFHTSHFIWIQKKQYRDDQRPYSPHWLLGALLSKPRLRGYRTDNRSSLCDGELDGTKSQPTDLKAKQHTAGLQHMCGWKCMPCNDHMHRRCGDALYWDYSEDDSLSFSRSRANMCRWTQNHLQMGLLN